MLSLAVRKKLRPFGEGDEAKHRAAQFGAWAKAMLGNEAAERRCKEWGISINRAGNEGVDFAGGAVVADGFRDGNVVGGGGGGGVLPDCPLGAKERRVLV